MFLKNLTYAVSVLVLTATNMYAQDANLFVSEIEEERSSDPDDGKPEITASVNGVKIDEFDQVKIGKIETAVDDLGQHT